MNIRKIAAIYSIIIGIVMILWWLSSLATNQVPEIKSAPLQISYHLLAEFLTAILLLIGGFGMAIGLIVIGRKVVKTLATEVVTLSPTSALAASISVSLVMSIGTMLGLPLSGTHVIVAALIAVGWIGKTQVQSKQVKNILISWIITVPLSAVFGIMIFSTLKIFVPFLDLN